MSEIDLSSYVPLYIQIQRDLRAEILSRWNPGDQFLSDQQVAERYRVSRMTARQAVANLVQEGLLERRRGKGTFVSRPPSLTYDTTSSMTGSEQWALTGAAVTRKILVWEEVPAPRIEGTILSLEEAEPVLRFVKLRSIREVRMALDERYVPLKLGRLLEPGWVLEAGLERIFRERLGIAVGRRVREWEAVGASINVAENLDVPTGAPVLRQKIVTYSAAGEPLLVGWSHYRSGAVKVYSVVDDTAGREGLPGNVSATRDTGTRTEPGIER